jgi:hypothetical protein
LRPRFIDHEVSIPEKPAIQHLDRLAGLLLRRHLDEPESARPSRELVRDDPNRLHGPGLLKELAKVLLGGLEGEISDEQLSGHRTDLLALAKAAEKGRYFRVPVAGAKVYDNW